MPVQDVVIRRLEEAELESQLPALARLRIAVFRDYPYLYDGSIDYERRYLETYATTPGSVIVGAFAAGGLVGAATALPLAGEPENVKAPLQAAGLAVERLFYFGESVLMQPWRGRGIGVAFFREREAHARRSGTYSHAVFCGVIRPVDHPRRPPDYVPLDGFWQRRGFARLEGVTCIFSWRDLDEPSESPKRMQFWIKRL